MHTCTIRPSSRLTHPSSEDENVLHRLFNFCFGWVLVDCCKLRPAASCSLSLRRYAPEPSAAFARGHKSASSLLPQQKRFRFTYEQKLYTRACWPPARLACGAFWTRVFFLPLCMHHWTHIHTKSKWCPSLADVFVIWEDTTRCNLLQSASLAVTNCNQKIYLLDRPSFYGAYAHASSAASSWPPPSVYRAHLEKCACGYLWVSPPK